MSYTNTTPNYDLPQFEASDRMTPVADFNGAFSAIDTALKANADNIADMDSDVADAKSDAESALTTANSVASTANNALLQAQTANTTAGNALSTANSATTTANSAKATAEASAENLADEFDSSATYTVGDYVIYNGVLYKCRVAHTGDFVSADFTAVKIVDEMGGSSDYANIFSRMFDMTSEVQTITPVSGITLNASSEVVLATNADKSLGKVYGQVIATVAVSTAGFQKIATIASGLNTISSEYIMKGYSMNAVANNVSSFTNGYLKFLTDGTVELWGNINSAITNINCDLKPCILVLQDFGD